MATFLLGNARSNAVTFSGLQLVTDLTRLPLETSWRTADGSIVTAFGQDLAIDATGTYSGTAEDIRIADATGAIRLVVRGINLPLLSLTSGLDTATLNGGDDLFAGSDLADTIDGGAGNDLFVGQLDGDVMDGGADTDTIDFSAFMAGLLQPPVTVNLTDGTATASWMKSGTLVTGFATLANIENIIGGSFDDRLTGNAADNLIRGLGGDDIISGLDGEDTLDGGDGHDEIWGGNGGDKIYGGSGDDLVRGEGDNDLIYGNAGVDTLDGGDGHDDIFGGEDGDKIYGGNGDDLIRGEGDNDLIYGNAGVDTLDGGDGHDDIFGGEDGDKIYGGNGDDLIRGEGDNDLIYGNAGVDTLDGGDGDDLIFGCEGVDKIYGGNGNDDLYGDSGNDLIYGNGGIDFITGGRGRDVMSGGGSRDYFNFDSLYEMGRTSATRDVITDFRAGLDDIDLATIDANSLKAGNQAFSFRGTAAFSGVAGQLRYTKSDAAGTANDRTIIEGDINGDKKADFQIELSGLKTLSAYDFLL